MCARARKNDIGESVAEAEVPIERPLDPDKFQTQLAHWYKAHARKLPWRGIRNPYATWLSEIMLQQTRVATVIDRYAQFLEKFPSLQALAMAQESEVLALWSGLGYYRRARMLHRAAQFVTRELGGKLPHSSTELRSLPGIGDYTAAAIASIAFGESIAVVDGNVERVLLRILGKPEDGTNETRLLLKRTAQSLVPLDPKPRPRANPPGTHNQAMMELGATICLAKQPLCLQCPVLEFCRTRGEHATLKRQPQKSRVVAHLLALRKKGVMTEVLLEKRAVEASLMPGMFELPPLPLDAVEGREPLLRVRHAITNTNYYVQVYTPTHGAPSDFGHDAVLISNRGPTVADGIDTQGESTRGFSRRDAAEHHHAESHLERERSPLRVYEPMDDEVFEAVSSEPADSTLLQAIPAAADDLQWTPVAKLAEKPLTGLARKVLQRLRVMRVEPPKLP